MAQTPLPQNRALTEADISALFAAQVRESRFIEFKGEFLLDSGGGKKKFLQSIAAFANAHGGDFLMGISEADGEAKGFAPLQIDPDQTRLRVLDLVRAHFRPALGGVQVDCVRLAQGGFVVVVRVPKSWAGPHMLTFDDDRRFYIRGDGGKRPMEYEEVRDGFVGGELIGAQLRNYRMERCAAVMNDDTPVLLTDRTRLILHILPFSILARSNRLEVRELFGKCDALFPIRGSGGRDFDADGVFALQRYQHEQAKAEGYAMVFRSGAIEAVDCSFFDARRSGDDKPIPYEAVERDVIKSVERYLTLLQSIEVFPPYAFALTLLAVKDYYMPSHDGGRRITKNDLFIPEVIWDAVPDSVSHALFPVFNSVWNACGFPQSLNYDSSGNWTARK
jgi:hypothetical protein